MANLRSSENKLREFLIRKIKNEADRPMLTRKYGNIRFKIDCKKYDRPHFIIKMGISEAAFDIDSGIIISGGLGQESNDIKSWVGKYLNKQEVKSIWQAEQKNYLLLKQKEDEAAEANMKRKADN